MVSITYSATSESVRLHLRLVHHWSMVPDLGQLACSPDERRGSRCLRGSKGGLQDLQDTCQWPRSIMYESASLSISSRRTYQKSKRLDSVTIVCFWGGRTPIQRYYRQAIKHSVFRGTPHTNCVTTEPSYSFSFSQHCQESRRLDNGHAAWMSTHAISRYIQHALFRFCPSFAWPQLR